MKKTKQSLSLLISYSLVFMPLHAANLEVDGSTNTTLDSAGNGVPVVNIANPNATGLSHNRFNEYNVGSNGLILNNSRDTTVNTQLGGHIYGNTNLSSNARVILNEVTSTSRSQLNGYTEVAGQRADLVIANPNGITINGAGFINTSNITLTTGTPLINNGAIDSFNVLGGDILIEGDGLDATLQDSAYIYTHYLRVNAAIHAKNLDVRLGKLDSSALGGMYANRISLVGTEQGLGVNLPPEVLASSGDITITNDGMISLQKITAKEDITVQSNSDIELNNNAYATNITLDAKDKITNNGNLSSKESLNISSTQLENKKKILVGMNEDESINGSGVLKIDTDALVNSGSIQSTNISDINTKTLSNSKDITASNTLNITATDLATTGGEISATNLEITTDTLTSTDTNILAVEDLTIEASSKIDNGGVIQANKTVNIKTKILNNTNSLISEDMIVNADSINNDNIIHASNSLTASSENITNRGTISGSNLVKLDVSNKIDNQNSKILSLNSLEISSKELNNANGKIKSNVDSSINTNHINNTNGNIESVNNLTLTTETIDLDSSDIYAGKNLTLKLNALDNIASSSIEAGAHLSINAASHITNDSALLSNGLITLTTDGALTNTNTISSASGLNINADSLVNNVTISGGTGVSKINIVNDIENNSRISSAENLEVSAKNITNDGFFNAGQDLTITSDNLTNNKTLFSGKDMILYTKDTLRNNEDANIYAVNNLTMSANSANDKTKHIINDKATIQTYEGDINIYAESLENITDDAEIETIVEETNILELALCGGYYYDSVTSGYDSVSFTNTCTGSLQYLNDIKADLVAEGKAYTEVTDVWKYSDGSTSAYTHQNEEQGLFINNVFYPKSELISYSEEYGKVTFQYKDLTGKDTDGNPFVPKKIKYIYADGAEVTSILNQYYNQFGVTVTYDAVTRIGNLVYGEKVHHIKLTPNNRETKRQYNTQVSRDQITLPSQKSKIASGKDLNLHLNNGRNYLSEISAVNIIDFDVDGNFINKAEELFRYNESTGKYYYCASDCSQLLHDPDYEWAALPSSSSQESIETIFSTIQAGVDITGDISSLDNSYTITQIAATTEQNEQTDTTNITRTTNLETIDSNTVQISDISVPTDNYGLFVRSTNPNSNYLIETNPEFALYENFISSDYMMEHIDYDSEATTRRLGDAFYENTLIRDSIFAQTGRRFLDKDINSDLEQYKRLMDNAIQANKDFELSPGIALNKEQINALKQDIVWMEEQIVAGEKVLVPVVYIAYVDNYKLEGAQIIAGRDVDLKVDTLTNSGSLSAGANMSIEASDSIDNYGGLINADEDMKLLAKNDITNTAGTIKAKNIDITSTDGNIVNQRFAEDVDFSRFGGVDKQTLIGEAAKIVATNTLNISAKENILVQGSELNAKDINLNATNVDITTTVDNKDYFAGSSGNYIKEQSTTHLASNINADNININSTGITSVTGSNLNATENLNVTAKKIDVVAVNNTTYNETKISSEGMFKSSSTTTKRATSTNQASNLSGANVQLTTTQEDIDVVGSNLNAQETLALNSANDVNIDTGYNVDHKESKTVKTSMLSGGDLYSSRMDNIGSYDKTNVASNLNARDITINSKNADIKGSNLNADATVDINADSINIETAQDEHKTWEQHKEISLSFDQAVDGVAKLGAEMATLSLADTGSNDILSTEASYSDTKEQTTSIINQSSNINAGENLSLRANSGDIDVVGSNLNADGTTTLNAAKDVNILSAHDTNNHSYEETSGYIATKITTDEGMTTDIDLTLRDETENNSNAKGSSISSGNNLTLISANDTNIIGSDLSSGGDTSMQTGGELTIATAKNTASTSVDNLNIHIHAGGIPDIAMGDGQVEAELGRATLDKIKKTTTDTTVTSSNVNADESINLTSEKSILVEGSNLNAKEEVTLIADEDVTIKEAKETSEIKSDELHGVATAKFVVANEYAKIPYAVKAVEDAKDGVKDAKKSYSNYKKELSSQKTKLAQLKQDYKDGVGFIELVDVEEFEELVDDLSDDDKYYQANIALAGVTLATKSTALAAQIAKAAASSTTYGFSAGIELDIDAIEKQLEEQSTASVASNIKANVIKIQANNKATVQGSTLDAKESIDITATNTDILASKDNYDQSEDTQHQNVNISISTAGFSMSASADSSESNTNATTNANAQLLANNININTKETTNIIGANVNAQETLTLNTKNLNVASVQDTSKTKEHSIGISAGFGADGLSSLGANTSNASSKTKETILTNLTAKEVNINVDEHTDLKGATIASVDENGEDNGNLNFKTDTLTASSLNNTHNSKSTSVGLHVGASREQDTDANLKTTHIDGASTVAIDYTNDRTNSKTKTLATLGSGNIQIANAEDSDTKMLNRDVENNTVDIYDISSHKGLKGELDTRLLTEDGRNQIKEDLERSKRLGGAIADVATSEAYELQDTVAHIDELQKDLDIQKAFALANDGKGIETLQGENSTIEQKQEAITQYAKIYADTYGISIEEANIIATDKFVKGAHYSNDNENSTIAINDNAQKNATDYAQTMGHEVTHARISQGTTRDRESDTLNEAYAESMGSYSADGMAFSSSTYNHVNLDSKLNTNKHIQTANDKELLNTNNVNFTKKVVTNPDNVEFSTAYSDFHNYEKKKEEIESFEQIAQQKEASGDISVAQEYREEIARLKNDVESFEKEYGTGHEALTNISDEYNKADVEKVQAIAAIVGSEDIQAALDGDPLTIAEFAASVIPVAKLGKHFVQIGDKLTEVSKETYDKIKSGVDKVVDNKTFDNLAGTQLSKDVKAYAKDLEKITELKLPSNQKTLLNKALKENKYTKLTDTEYKEHIKFFNNPKNKKKIRSEWEKNTGKKWPTYVNDKGQATNYDMHHIVEKQYGGTHSWWNMIPARGGSNKLGLNQHQAGIHRTDSIRKVHETNY